MKIAPITKDDIALFHKYLLLDEGSGIIRWKTKIAKKTVVGEEAGFIRDDGYKAVQLFGRRYMTHRVVFGMVNGAVDQEIDHINGDICDNRPSNLRAATRSQQNMNKRLSRANSTGYQGVYFNRPKNLFNARIRVNCRRISLGYFKTPEEAYAAYLAGIEKYHGEYRRAY